MNPIHKLNEQRAPRPQSRRKFLITGGAGYIGSHAALRLLEDGHAVTVVDDLSRGHREAIDLLGRDAVRALGPNRRAIPLPTALARKAAAAHVADM